MQAIFAAKQKKGKLKFLITGGKSKQWIWTFEELWLKDFNPPLLTTFMLNLPGMRNTRYTVYDDDDCDNYGYDEYDDDDDDDDDV